MPPALLSCVRRWVVRVCARVECLRVLVRAPPGPSNFFTWRRRVYDYPATILYGLRLYDVATTYKRKRIYLPLHRPSQTQRGASHARELPVETFSGVDSNFVRILARTCRGCPVRQISCGSLSNTHHITTCTHNGGPPGQTSNEPHIQNGTEYCVVAQLSLRDLCACRSHAHTRQAHSLDVCRRGWPCFTRLSLSTVTRCILRAAGR